MLPDPEAAIEVDAPALAALLESGPGSLRLIDCREEDEWLLCRIGGATLVPLSTFAESVSAWDNTAPAPLVVYCHHGVRSLQAARYLRAKGFEKSFSLAGGIDAWSEEVDRSVPRY